MTSINALGAPSEIGQSIEQQAPDFCVAADDAAQATALAVGLVYEALRPQDSVESFAARNVICQVANDWLDLLYELRHGRGRASLRGARSLYEHAVAAHDVTTSTPMAQRFVDHQVVGEYQRAELVRVESMLEGAALRGYRHWAKKVRRDAGVVVTKLVDTYGSTFKRSWTDATLYDRAAAAGLSAGYDFYRVASQPTHGAAGGIIGSNRTIGDRDVYRTGPNLEACIPAAVYGLDFCRAAVSAIDEFVGAGSAAFWLESLDALEATLAEYAGALQSIDRDLWPDGAPLNIAPMEVVSTRHDAELWITYPEQQLAHEYFGDFKMTQQQHDVLRLLTTEILPRLDFDRIGIMILEPQAIDAAKIRPARLVPLRDVVPTRPIEITPDGVVHLPEDLPSRPYVDDILGRRS